MPVLAQSPITQFCKFLSVEDDDLTAFGANGSDRFEVRKGAIDAFARRANAVSEVLLRQAGVNADAAAFQQDATCLGHVQNRRRHPP